MTKPIATDEAKQAYIDALSRSGIVATAMRVAGIGRRNLQDWLAKDEEFAQGVEDAMLNAADLIEEAAFGRAVNGVERERVIGSGDSARYITEVVYSDALLQFLLKGAKPEKYAERTKSEISGPGGKAVELTDTAVAARITALLEAAKGRKDGEGVDPLS